MYIFQPDRHLLMIQIKKYSKYIAGKVLDIGAGRYSRYTDLFHCAEYVKMDIEKNNNIDIIGSAEAIPFSESIFDSVICNQVLEYLPNPQIAMNEIHRILKPNGYALITAPQTNELHDEPHDLFRYTNFALKKLAEKAGLTVITCEQRGGFFSTIAQMRIRYIIDSLDLYNKPVLGGLANIIFRLYGATMIGIDKYNKSEANRKHAIGWLLLVQKKYENTVT